MMFDRKGSAENSYPLIKNWRKGRSSLSRAAFRVCVLLAAACAGIVLGRVLGDGSRALTFILPALAFLAVLSVRKMEEWERAIVLRLGRFHRVKGPGLILLAPGADRIASVVDLRIRVSDFTAETTLSRDSVTVTVDALCFWLVWDAEKAILEVQDYEAAVILSAKTALRNAVSSHDLSVFLERGPEIEEGIRAEVDAKTTEWGITVQHIEITDIRIPESLQVSLSRVAEAEREKKGRVLLAEAEVEIARKLEEAARVYESSDTALNLKRLSILNEGLDAGNSMMIVPNSIAERLEGDDLFGVQALGKMARAEREARAANPRAASGKPRASAAPRDAAAKPDGSRVGKGKPSDERQ